MSGSSLRSLGLVTALSMGLLAVAACGGAVPATPVVAPTSTPQPSMAAATSGATGLPTARGTANIDPAAPCTALSQAAAENAVGQQLGVGVVDVSRASVGLGTCTFTSSDYLSSVTVTVGGWPAVHADEPGGSVPTTIEGVGDEAMAVVDAQSTTTLFVRAGASGLEVVASGPTIQPAADHGLAVEEAVVAAILTR